MTFRKCRLHNHILALPNWHFSNANQHLIIENQYFSNAERDLGNVDRICGVGSRHTVSLYRRGCQVSTWSF
jgi:hypothetical protein